MSELRAIAASAFGLIVIGIGMHLLMGQLELLTAVLEGLQR